jgi:hypothetical protein
MAVSNFNVQRITITNNLNKKIKQIKGVTMQGVLSAGLFVQRKAQRVTPREKGILHASAFTRRSRDNENTVQIGYEAAYGIFVHERVAMKLRGVPRKSGIGVYWGPDGQAKFLERTFRESASEVLAIIRKHAAQGVKK